jgi:hypothetical protein
MPSFKENKNVLLHNSVFIIHSYSPVIVLFTTQSYIARRRLGLSRDTLSSNEMQEYTLGIK